MEKTSRWPAGRRGLRPCDTLGAGFRDPSEDPGLQALLNSAVSFEGTSQVCLSDIGITWKTHGVDGYGTPMYVRNNTSLTIDGLTIDDRS